MIAIVALASLLTAGCRLPSEAGAYPSAEIDDVRVLIAQVQGRGDTSPLLERDVVIEGVVIRSLAGDADALAQEVGETLGEGNRGQVVGWFVQDEGDDDPATSDALFVLDQGYDTSLNLPAQAEYTARLGSRIRSGDRIQARGKVMELPQTVAAEQARSGGHPVGRGIAAGTITAIAATSITVLEPGARAIPIVVALTPPEQAANENVEGMRLSRISNGANRVESDSR